MTADLIRLGQTDDPAHPWLRGVDLGDQDVLRCWRNSHAHRFFDQQSITAASQQCWFEEYLVRPDDFLFMVMAAEQPVGCIGIRFRDGEWDLYNVMRGGVGRGSAGFMSQALAAVIAFARDRRPTTVRADVLADNPAVAWYLSNGFVIEADDGRTVRLRHQPEVGEECLRSG
jgi:ribosomal protein S18 acetylase RimI-like enzyme